MAYSFLQGENESSVATQDIVMINVLPTFTKKTKKKMTVLRTSTSLVALTFASFSPFA